MGSLPTVLRDRDVRLVWSSSVVSAIGTGAMFVALPYYTYVATGSVLATALVTLAEYAPTVGIAQLAGVLVDRWDPRRTLIAVDLALAVCTVAYLLHPSWWWLAVVAFTRSSVAQFATPAAHTLIPAVAPVGRLAEVNALNAIGGNIARLAGPALGGILVGAGGLPTVVITDAVTFLLAAVLTAGIHLPEHKGRASTDGLLRSWRRGWSTVRRHPVLRPLMIVMALVGLGEGFVSALLAPWMIDTVGGGGAELGLMLSGQAVGGILGGVLVVRIAHRWHSLTLLGAGAIVSGVLLVAIFNYPLVAPVGPWPAIILTAVAGLPFAVYGTAQTIAVQTHSGDGLRGRVVGLTFGVQGMAQLLGIAVAGPAASLVGPLIINVDAVVYLAAGAVALATTRRLR
jgi:MFS family permease